MKLRALVMRALRGESADEPIRLHVSAPTVLPEEAARLAARPVRRKSTEPHFSFGIETDKTPAQRLTPTASADTGEALQEALRKIYLSRDRSISTAGVTGTAGAHNPGQLGASPGPATKLIEPQPDTFVTPRPYLEDLHA